MNKDIRGHNKGLLRTYFRSNKETAYTERELTRVRDVLTALGYVHKPEGLYGQDDLSHLMEDYVKADSAGRLVGTVSLHLDVDGKDAVQDGLVCITDDKSLKTLTGAVTTVSAFALMFKSSADEELGSRVPKLTDRQP